MSEIGEKVAEHYNSLEEKGLDERNKSRIFHLRNFNNWIKSMLIGETLKNLKGDHHRMPLNVLDIGCGKGGDLLKWKKGEISYLVCVDIAGTSIEQCESRFKDVWRRNNYERRPATRYEAEFITADCTKTRLQPLYKKQDIKFDLVSCQFAFHYCFESIQQVDQMLQNASECLRPGGFFIGTTPDSYEILKRLKAADGLSYGNDIYQVTFKDKERFDLFGAQYNFHLEEVVDCPEFLVYFPVLLEMAKRHNLELVFRTRFDDYFWECLKSEDKARQQDARQLLGKMQALETYPAFESSDQSSSKEQDFVHAVQHIATLNQDDDDRRRPIRVGTLSLPEWEAITLYVAFAFKKVEASVSPASPTNSAPAADASDASSG